MRFIKLFIEIIVKRFILFLWFNTFFYYNYYNNIKNKNIINSILLSIIILNSCTTVLTQIDGRKIRTFSF